MNHAWLNGTHPALLAAHGFNSDVQLPYRFPITEATHSSHVCLLKCFDFLDERTMVNAAQVSQDAQAGYACDYQNKRQPMACNEKKSVARAAPP